MYVDCLSESWPAMGGTRRVVATASHGKGEGRGEMMGPAASAVAETTSHKSLDVTSDDWTDSRENERERRRVGAMEERAAREGWWDLEEGGGGWQISDRGVVGGEGMAGR